MRLALLSILRDEATRLPQFLAALEDLEAHPSVGELCCSFYENDSRDATAALLGEWLRHRRGYLQTERLNQPRLRGREPARTQRLAAARNQALLPLLQHWPVGADAWLVVVDADLRISAAQVLALIAVLGAAPGAAMACASAEQNVPDLFGHGAWSYYDTFALVDRAGRRGLTYAAVPFWDPADRATWLAGRPVSVASAFGGMAVAPLALVRQLQVRWNGAEGCEHWAFCAGLRQAGAVLACPHVRPRVVHPHPPRWSTAYRQQRQAQLRTLWRQQGLPL